MDSYKVYNNFVTDKISGALVCAVCKREQPKYRSLTTAREALIDHILFYSCGGSKEHAIWNRVAIDGVELVDPDALSRERIKRMNNYSNEVIKRLNVEKKVATLEREIEELQMRLAEQWMAKEPVNDGNVEKEEAEEKGPDNEEDEAEEDEEDEEEEEEDEIKEANSSNSEYSKLDDHEERVVEKAPLKCRNDSTRYYSFWN